MVIYCIIIFLLFVSVYVENTAQRRHLDIDVANRSTMSVYLIMVFIITLVSAIRYDVGADCLGYYEEYDDLKDGITFGLQNYEPGFLFFNKLLGHFFTNPQTIIVATSLIINVLIAFEIKRRSKYPLFSLFCYVTFFFYFVSLNVIRQYIAIGVVFLAFGYLFKNNKKGYLIYALACIFASLFHISGLIGLLGLLAYKLRQNTIIKIAIVVLAIFLYMSVGQISSLLISYFPVYDIYSDYGREGGSDSSIFILSIILFISWFFEKRLNNRIQHYNFYQNCIALGVFLNILAGVNIMYARMGMYFTINLIVFVPMVISTIKNENRGIFRIMVLALSIAYCFWNLSNNNGRVLPYKTIFGF